MELNSQYIGWDTPVLTTIPRLLYLNKEKLTKVLYYYSKLRNLLFVLHTLIKEAFVIPSEFIAKEVCHEIIAKEITKDNLK